MRENRTYGSVGREARAFLTPYQAHSRCKHITAYLDVKARAGLPSPPRDGDRGT